MQITQRFQENSIPLTIPEFFNIVNNSRYLHKRRYVSLEAIADKIIERSPSEIRTII